MIHFDIKRFPNLQYVEIEGRNIFLEKNRIQSKFVFHRFYFSGEAIKEQMVPRHKILYFTLKNVS